MAKSEPPLLTPLRKEPGDKEVMGLMRKQATPDEGPFKSPDDIIWESASRLVPPNLTKEQFLSALGQMTQNPNNRFLQVGNTVFLMMKTAPDTIEFHTFTIEPMGVLPQRFMAASKAVKQLGIRKVIAYADQPGFLQVARKLDLPVKIDQTQKVMGGVAKPVYRFEVDL